jgi:hypothetical protein
MTQLFELTTLGLVRRVHEGLKTLFYRIQETPSLLNKEEEDRLGYEIGICFDVCCKHFRTNEDDEIDCVGCPFHVIIPTAFESTETQNNRIYEKVYTKACYGSNKPGAVHFNEVMRMTAAMFNMVEIK